MIILNGDVLEWISPSHMKLKETIHSVDSCFSFSPDDDINKQFFFLQFHCYCRTLIKFIFKNIDMAETNAASAHDHDDDDFQTVDAGASTT
jgi:hypothetical protein